MKVLIIGDIVGAPGRKIAEKYITKNKYEYDLIIINGENSASGKGITKGIANDFFNLGVDVITTGNHVWDKKEIVEYLQENNNIIRPYNYPSCVPGFGYTMVKSKKGDKVAVVSLQGRTFMNAIDCPFTKGKELIEELKKETNIIIIDFHAEATSEKIGLGWYLDGNISMLFGTHTHVQTADERILAKGTGFITDIGMTGGTDGVIGTKKESVIERFLTGLPQKFEVEDENVRLNGIKIELDRITGKCISIERINISETEV